MVEIWYYDVIYFLCFPTQQKNSNDILPHSLYIHTIDTLDILLENPN
jgi:hypothetical protein